MRELIVISALVAFNADPASATVGPMDGSWSVTNPYPCPAGNDECKGMSDSFSLDLWSSGLRLCGTHLATAHSGNRVDEDEGWEPSIVGSIHRDKAKVAYRSSWGGSGHATLTLENGHLHWHVATHDDAPSWIWGDAVLTKQLTNPNLPKVCVALDPVRGGL